MPGYCERDAAIGEVVEGKGSVCEEEKTVVSTK
jgi:hypothetical protein